MVEAETGSVEFACHIQKKALECTIIPDEAVKSALSELQSLLYTHHLRY